MPGGVREHQPKLLRARQIISHLPVDALHRERGFLNGFTIKAFQVAPLDENAFLHHILPGRLVKIFLDIVAIKSILDIPVFVADEAELAKRRDNNVVRRQMIRPFYAHFGKIMFLPNKVV